MSIPIYSLEIGAPLFLLSLFSLNYFLKFYRLREWRRTYTDVLYFFSHVGIIGASLLLLAHLQISGTEFEVSCLGHMYTSLSL